MTTLKQYLVPAVISALIAVVIGLGFKTVESMPKAGTIGAGITNYSGISITGTPGSLDASGTVSFSGTVIDTGTTVLNNVVQSGNGFTLTLSTANGNSQAITAAQFCSAATVLIPITSTTTLTLTLPPATSTVATCGASLGSWASQYIDNESSSVVTIATSTGDIKGQGIQIYLASSTALTAAAGAYPMTSTGLALPATTTLLQTGIYTGTSTTNVILNMLNTFFKRQF